MDFGKSCRFSLTAAQDLSIVTNDHKSCSTVDLTNNRIDSSLRSFIAHTAGVFRAFRGSLRDSNEHRQIVPKVSKLYRSALSQLNEQTTQPVFRLVESIWHLCEILVIEQQPAGYLIQHLQGWAASLDTSTAERLASLDESDEESFWDLILTLITYGLIDDAMFVLQKHSSWPREDFTLMAKILESIPVLGGENQVPLQFLEQWKIWQDTVRQVLAEARFGLDTHFHSACLILTGDESEFDRKKDLFDSWFHLVISKVAYTQPLAKVSDVARAADKIKANTDFLTTDTLSEVATALLRVDLHSLTNSLASLDDFWWTGAHLVDLLAIGGYLKNSNVQHAEALHEQFLRDYALCLSRKALWETSLLYLNFCGSTSRSKTLLIEALTSVHCQTQYKTLKVATMAEKLGIPEAAIVIYRIQSMKAIKQKRCDTALTWAIRSRNSPLVSRVAELVLEEFLSTGKISCRDQLESIGQEMLISERLSFLAKYNEFLKLREVDQDQSCELLLFLIDSQWSPEFFVAQLLKDSVVLLEKDDVSVKNVAHLQRLMACLQRVVKERPGDLKKDLQDKLNFVCAKKMSRSLLGLMRSLEQHQLF